MEAFLSNFMRQCKNPTTFGFFKVPADRFDSVGVAMGDLIKDPEKNAACSRTLKVICPNSHRRRSSHNLHSRQHSSPGGSTAGGEAEVQQHRETTHRNRREQNWTAGKPQKEMGY